MNKKIDEEQLYQAAITIFARYGFNKTRMGDISAALGLAAGTIYRYVSHKKELYEKTVAFGVRQWQENSLVIIADYDDPLEQLVVLMLTGYQYMATNRELLTLMVETPAFLSTSPAEDPLSEINRESIMLVDTLLATGIRQGCFRKIDTRQIAETLFTIYMLFIIKIFIKNEGKRAWEMALNGFEVALQGIIHRNVDEERPMTLLKKHLATLKIDI